MQNEEQPPVKAPGRLVRTARFVAMPVSKPIEQIRQSTRNTQERLALMREAKERRMARIRELEKISATERFDKIYQEKSWTEPELVDQISAIRKAKWAALISCMFWLLGFGVLMLYVDGFLRFGMLVVMIGVMTLSVTQMFRYALFEAQLKLRSLITAKEFMDREDMWQRILT